MNANKTRELVFATMTFFYACGLEIQRYHLSLSDLELLGGRITPGQYKQQYSLIWHARFWTYKLCHCLIFEVAMRCCCAPRKKSRTIGVSFEEIKNQCALKRENNCLLVRGNDLDEMLWAIITRTLCDILFVERMRNCKGIKWYRCTKFNAKRYNFRGNPNGPWICTLYRSS